MNLLEMFSGTGSVGLVAKSLGFNVISLDLKNADINTDILKWDYKQFDRNHFDFIWSSPPCTEYSIAKTRGIRNIEYANSIVLKTIEIIKYFNPKYFVIENPQTGLLKNQEFMDEFEFKDVDYCKYGFNYRKRTRLWNNITTWKPRDLCKKDCGNITKEREIRKGNLTTPKHTRTHTNKNKQTHTHTGSEGSAPQTRSPSSYLAWQRMSHEQQ